MRRAPLVLAVIASVPLAAMAQTPQDVLTRAEILQAAPPGQTISAPGLQFGASNEGGTVSLKWGLAPTATLPEPLKDGIVPRGATFTSWSVTAEAPLGKSEKSHALFSLDGFGSATTLGATYYQFVTDWDNKTVAEREKFKALCKEMQDTAPLKDDKKVDCSGTNFRKYLPHKYSEARAMFPGPMPGGLFYGATGKYGSQDTTHYDANSLAKQTGTNHPWSVGGFVGLIPKSLPRSMLTLKVDRKRTFKDADAAVRCPQSTTFPVQCVSGAFGPPRENTGTVVTLDGRTFLSGTVAMGLTVARDTSRNVTSVEVPIYWMTNASGGIIGGVKVNWNSEDRKTGVGLFVGVPFSAFQ